LNGLSPAPRGAEWTVVTFTEEGEKMVASFASASRAANALWRMLTWPARVSAARRTMTELARMSEYELRDIGLTRSDVNDATALPLDADPSGLLRGLIEPFAAALRRRRLPKGGEKV
jgi:uncharacterized protein YjiS (DUF1127 family)